MVRGWRACRATWWADKHRLAAQYVSQCCGDFLACQRDTEAVVRTVAECPWWWSGAVGLEAVAIRTDGWVAIGGGQADYDRIAAVDLDSVDVVVGGGSDVLMMSGCSA